MITIPTQLIIWRWPSKNKFGMWIVLYWTRSSRTQFGVSIKVLTPAGDTLNITCNFLYCNHQVHRLFDHPVHTHVCVCACNFSITAFLKTRQGFWTLVDILLKKGRNWIRFIFHSAMICRGVQWSLAKCGDGGGECDQSVLIKMSLYGLPMDKKGLREREGYGPPTPALKYIHVWTHDVYTVLG